MKGRTQKDENDYHANLRREAPIQQAVIAELRQGYRQLLEQQARLLQALLTAEASLRLYRSQSLANTRYLLELPESKCLPGCKRHTWNNLDGWHDSCID